MAPAVSRGPHLRGAGDTAAVPVHSQGKAGLPPSDAGTPRDTLRRAATPPQTHGKQPGTSPAVPPAENNGRPPAQLRTMGALGHGTGLARLSVPHPSSVVTPVTAQPGPFAPVLSVGTTRCSWSRRVARRGPGGLSLVTGLGQEPQLLPRGSWLQRARGGPAPARHSPCPRRHDPQSPRVLESLRQPLLGEPRPMGDSVPAGHRARGHRRTETTKEAKLWSLGTCWWWPGAIPCRATPQPCGPWARRGDGRRGDRVGGPAVSPRQLPPRWPRGHGKGCARGRSEGHPAPVPSRSRHRHGDRDEPPWGESTATRPRPRRAAGTYLMQECLRDGQRLPGCMPPAPLRPAPRPALPQPLVLPLPRVPDGTGDTKPHCGSYSPARELWVCSPPPLRHGAATSDPAATPGDSPDPGHGVTGRTRRGGDTHGVPTGGRAPRGERDWGARPGRRPREGWCRIQKYFPCRAVSGSGGGGAGGAAINSCCCH